MDEGQRLSSLKDALSLTNVICRDPLIFMVNAAKVSHCTITKYIRDAVTNCEAFGERV